MYLKCTNIKKKYFEIRDKKKGEKVMRKRKVKRQLENRESN